MLKAAVKDKLVFFAANISTAIILSASGSRKHKSLLTLMVELPVAGWMPNIHKPSFLQLPLRRRRMAWAETLGQTDQSHDSSQGPRLCQTTTGGSSDRTHQSMLRARRGLLLFSHRCCFAVAVEAPAVPRPLVFSPPPIATCACAVPDCHPEWLQILAVW